MEKFLATRTVVANRWNAAIDKERQNRVGGDELD
jgi:hypothetical protein